MKKKSIVLLVFLTLVLAAVIVLVNDYFGPHCSVINSTQSQCNIFATKQDIFNSCKEFVTKNDTGTNFTANDITRCSMAIFGDTWHK